MFKEVKEWTQIISLYLSIIINLILIYLVLTKSPKKMGTYKFLMVYFSLISISLSILDYFLKLSTSNISNCYIIFMQKDLNGLSENLNHILLCVICGFYSVTIATIAVHFVFRYFAIERKGKLKYFQGIYLFAWLCVPIVFGSIWTATVYLCLTPGKLIADEISSEILKDYNLTMDQIIYVGGSWRDHNGEINSYIAKVSVIFGALMTTSVLTVSYFGFRIYHLIQNLIQKGRSEFTRNLQKQLYKALILQTIIPILLLYLPVGCFIFLPFLVKNAKIVGNIVNIGYAIYPVLDPLPTLLIIDNYRRAILYVFCCCPDQQVGPTESTNSETRASTMDN